jgi:hypothetical protein
MPGLFSSDALIASIKDRLIRAVKTYSGEWFDSLSDAQRARVLETIGHIAVHLFHALIEPDNDDHLAFAFLALDTLKTDAITANIRAADRIGEAWARAFGGFIGGKLDGVKLPFSNPAENPAPLPQG